MSAINNKIVDFVDALQTVATFEIDNEAITYLVMNNKNAHSLYETITALYIEHDAYNAEVDVALQQAVGCLEHALLT